MPKVLPDCHTHICTHSWAPSPPAHTKARGLTSGEGVGERCQRAGCVQGQDRLFLSFGEIRPPPENPSRELRQEPLPALLAKSIIAAWPRSAWPTDRRASDSSAEFLMSSLHPPLPTLSLTPQQALGGITRLSFLGFSFWSRRGQWPCQEEKEALVCSFSPLLVRKGLQSVTGGLLGIRPVASACE